MELSVQGCLKGLGISLLCELDVLAFAHRHGAILARTNQIASLVGHEVAAVDSALKELESKRLIDRSRPSQGAFLFRFMTPTEDERKRCFRQLISLLESREGRVLAAKQLKSDGADSQVEICTNPESKGNSYGCVRK